MMKLEEMSTVEAVNCKAITNKKVGLNLQIKLAVNITIESNSPQKNDISHGCRGECKSGCGLSRKVWLE